MNGRETYFNTVNFRSGRMAQWLKAVLFSPEEVGMQVQIPTWHLPVFFSFIVFLPFGFLLFILTADLVSFARFLRKRISSLLVCFTQCTLFFFNTFVFYCQFVCRALSLVRM